jgi:hypothetical protein
MNPCVQISDSKQQKRQTKNQQEAKVFFKHFLVRLAAWEYEKKLDQFDHLPRY